MPRVCTTTIFFLSQTQQPQGLVGNYTFSENDPASRAVIAPTISRPSTSSPIAAHPQNKRAVAHYDTWPFTSAPQSQPSEPSPLAYGRTCSLGSRTRTVSPVDRHPQCRDRGVAAGRSPTALPRRTSYYCALLRWRVCGLSVPCRRRRWCCRTRSAWPHAVVSG